MRNPPTAFNIPSLPTDGFIRQSQFLRYVPYSPATFWRRVAAGRAPQPVKLGDRITAFRVEEVRRYLADPLGFKAQQ